jgi:hypothetical protein
MAEHHHTVEVRIGVTADGEGNDQLTAVTHCANCGTTEEFTMNLHHAAPLAESLLSALTAEGITGPGAPLFKTRTPLKGQDMGKMLRRKPGH